MSVNMSHVIAFAAILTAAFSFGDFIRNPEKYGEIMRRYDGARFGSYVCEQ